MISLPKKFIEFYLVKSMMFKNDFFIARSLFGPALQFILHLFWRGDAYHYGYILLQIQIAFVEFYPFLMFKIFMYDSFLLSIDNRINCS
jgi:hypothetical protein